MCSFSEYITSRTFRFGSRVVATGLEPVVSLRSVNFAMVASRRCRLRRSLAQYASASLHPALRALGSSAPSMFHIDAFPTSIPDSSTKAEPPASGWLCFGGRNRTRTCDPIDVNDVLYQLSHATMFPNYFVALKQIVRVLV